MLKLCVEIKFVSGEILCYSMNNMRSIDSCRRKALRFLNFARAEVDNSLPIEKIINSLDTIDLDSGVVKYCNEYSIELKVIK